MFAHARAKFDAARAGDVRGAAENAFRILRASTTRPDSIEMEFGVKLTAEASAVIAKVAMAARGPANSDRPLVGGQQNGPAACMPNTRSLPAAKRHRAHLPPVGLGAVSFRCAVSAAFVERGYGSRGSMRGQGGRAPRILRMGGCGSPRALPREQVRGRSRCRF
jgi:hypothetical protein